MANKKTQKKGTKKSPSPKRKETDIQKKKGTGKPSSQKKNARKTLEEREQEIPSILKTQELFLGPREQYRKEQKTKQLPKGQQNLPKKKGQRSTQTTKNEKQKQENDNLFQKVEPIKDIELPKDDTSVDELLEEITKDLETKEKTSKHTGHTPKKWLWFDVVCFVLSLCAFFALQSISPKIKIKGKDLVQLEYGTEYKEKGATASYFNEDISNQIKTKGEVNTDKVGTYTIEYSVEVGNYHVKKDRTIEVVDRTKPVIQLTGEKATTICPNGTYKEEGAIATDDYDGDLTAKIERKEEKGKIIYTVEDSSKNKTTVERIIEEKDEEKPNITLKGGNIYLQPGAAYKEPGYTATDNCDGDISSKVTVKGKVETNTIGNYTLTYEVSDSSGNKNSVDRTVSVSNRTDPDSGVLKTGAIYLTFDDGPSSATTGRILDILKEEGVKATFFVTTNGPDSLIEREFNEGHTVALHTATHDYSYIYASRDNYFEDLNKVASRVKRITGYETKIIRFPGGTSNTVSRNYCRGIMSQLSEEVLNLGYRYFDWNVDASDAWQCAKQSVQNKKSCVYNNVVNNLSKTRANIVLMHDIKEYTVQALRDIIQYGKQNGYTFELIDMNTKMVRFRPLN